MRNDQPSRLQSTSTDSLSLGYWVRRRRKSLDLTQVELAELTACTASLIRKIESDQRRPSRQMAEGLAVALQLSPEDRPLFIKIARAEQSLDRLAALETDLHSSRPRFPDPTAAAPRPVHLPVDTTLFVGRTEELADIQRRLLDPACRLLTLVGQGGAGKTRLAVQSARLLAQQHDTLFAHGLFFVPLEAVTTTAGIITALADVVALRFYDSLPPKTQLLDYLRTKEILFVLDNFEHLDESETLLSEILAEAPHCKMLVTSRMAVKLHESWFHPVEGLSLPETVQRGEAASAQLTSDAVNLFIEAARRTQVNFPRSELSTVVRICHLVGGLPLGIELAAAWLKAIPIDEIAKELEKSLDLLTARHGNVPTRQRSMNLIIDSSWGKLQPEEASALMQMAVCRGGFRSDAAAAIAGASYLTLAVLVDHSMLRLLPNGRYAMHELIRQFSLERLRQSGIEEEARQRHALYFLDLLVDESQRLTGADQQTVLEKLEVERENLRVVWDWSVEHRRWELLDQVLDGIYQLYHIRSLYHEGDELCSLALQAQARDGRPEGTGLRARLLARRGSFCFALGDNRAAKELLDQSFSLLQASNRASELAFVCAVQGQLVGWQGDHLGSQELLAKSLALYEAANDRQGIATVRHKLAQLACSYGDYARGRALAGESLQLCQELGRPDWRAYAFDVLGWATICLGDYPEAESHYRRSLALFEESGDRLGVALALGGVSSVLWAMGDGMLLEGQRYMQQSLTLCREIGHRQHMASRLWYLAQFDNELGDYQAAREQAEAGLALAAEIDSRVFTAYNLCALGEALCALGDLPAAEQTLRRAIQLAAEDNQLPPLLIGLIRMAELWLKESECLPGAPGRRQHATDLLHFVAHHPACWMPYQQRIRTILSAHPQPSSHGTAVNSPARTLEAWIALVGHPQEERA